MPGILRPVTALLLATAIIMLGGGLQGVLLPLRATAENFSDAEIGWIGASYYAGLLFGSLSAPALISRVGHIRAFTALTAIVCTTPLMHVMVLDNAVWMMLRLTNGICFAGVLLIIESWLANASDEASRGRVLGAYSLIHLLVVTVGMQFINLAPIESFELFSIIAILFAVAAVPIALTQTIAPPPPSRPKLQFGWLYIISPAAFGGAMLMGVTNGAYWVLVPVYAQNAGFSLSEIAIFTAAGVIGGAIAQWPAGALSDKYGRRPVVIVLAAIASVCGFVLASGVVHRGPWVYVAIIVFGAANFPLYTLALAHANDLVQKKRAVQVSSGLLVVFSMGAIVGPLVGAWAMGWAGYQALFFATGIAHLAIVGIVFVHFRIRPRLPRRRGLKFVTMPRTTPAVYELDPRGEPRG